MLSSPIDNRLISILETEGPKSRSYIEAVCVFKQGFEPKEVTSSLRRLHLSKAILRTTVWMNGDGKETHIYSIGEISPPIHAQLLKLFEVHREVFDRDEIGRLGERYVRSLAIRSGCYERIPNLRRLGRIRIGRGAFVVDLLMRRKALIGDRENLSLLIEIKNRREWVYSNDTLFERLLANAIHTGAQPVLCATFISGEAHAFCRSVGIAVLETGRQFVPNKQRKKINYLSPILGPRPLEFVAPKRFYQDGLISSLALRDLEIVKSDDWLKSSSELWAANRDLIQQSLSGCWKTDRSTILSSI